MYDVITVGSSTVDILAKTEHSDMISIHSRNKLNNISFLAYPSGTKILLDGLEISTGGGGTNTAVAFSRLGLKVAYLGRIGKDDNGVIITDALKKEKVNFIGKFSPNRSGYSVVLDSQINDRTILTYKGCNNEFRFSQVNKTKLKTKWFYLCAMVDEAFGELEKIAHYAKKNKIKVMFNPSSYLAEKGVEYLRKMLRCTDILCLNREEAQYLVGRYEVKILLKLLKDLMGPTIVIITDGKNGVHVTDGKDYYKSIPNKIKVIETTGAGDAFGASFLTGYMKKKDIEFSIKLAVTNSESVVQHHGAKNKLLTWQEAMKKIKKVKVKKYKI